ncbi:glycosyltransferase [Pelagibaculum spongiae]|uniref:GT44 domain-containing protein n=1 Tax=Pelagibaculum spongiae TaxID=2080658 RepID=A0A2V1GUS1_9GAMM|nr:glycosyltransferase [Pelagibaculum spongiae]PVZ69759.1 hypothetical protein DC094_10705 [Pelagibaculum spongiae]
MIKETIDIALQSMLTQTTKLLRVYHSTSPEILQEFKKNAEIMLGMELEGDYRVKFKLITWFVCCSLNIDSTKKIPLLQFVNIVLIANLEDDRLIGLINTAKTVYSKLMFYLVEQNPIASSRIVLPSDQCVHRIWVGGKISEDQLVSMAAANLIVAKKMGFSQPVFHLWTDNSAMLHQKNTGKFVHFNLVDICQLYITDRTHPDFKLMNELVDYSRLLIKFREFAIASNLLRMIVLYQYGGFYLDATWVQSIFPIEPFASSTEPEGSLLSKAELGKAEFAAALTSNGESYERHYAFDYLSYQTPYFDFLNLSKNPSSGGFRAASNKTLVYVNGRFNPVVKSVLQNSKIYLDNRSRHEISWILVKYREFKHKHLRNSFIRGAGYNQSEDDLEFIVSLSALPFESALAQNGCFDFYIYNYAVHAEGAGQPMLSIKESPNTQYQFISNIGLVKKFSRSWKSLDLKDRQNAEWP